MVLGLVCVWVLVPTSVCSIAGCAAVGGVGLCLTCDFNRCVRIGPDGRDASAIGARLAHRPLAS